MLFPRIESVHPLRGACLRALKLGIQTDAKTRSNDKLLERICCAAIAHRISANHRSLRMWSRASSFERRRNSLERDKIGTAPRRMAQRDAPFQSQDGRTAISRSARLMGR